ncbi:MAG: tRNA (guanine(46)-N(7))-methyltransferase TrmB [Alphaproteobacteria bacterium]
MPRKPHIPRQNSANYERSFFGRRQGRSTSPLRTNILDELLPKIEIAETNLSLEHDISPAEILGRSYSNYWLEIGFGYGEHLATLMRDNPETGYLGAEPFIGGMSAFLMNLQESDNENDNVRVVMDDGMIIARSVKPSSIDGIYVLNPDPWHKKRHHKRRIINQSNLDVFAKILKPGGQLVLTTDVENLAEWMCTQASHHPSFNWTASHKSDFYTPPEDWITTRYEEKGAKGAKKMVYMFFERN